ncbi:MAG: EFR1 family ferrodoxin [Firmicutes bacterium]|nr:EFR1 family ferrodoxin [Bacillota bacterium]
MNKIFCYTGTGNSYAASKQLALEINAEVVHITQELVESRLEVVCDVCVIVFPVYAYGMPKTVKRFIKATRFSVEYFAVLVTQGSMHGGALAEAIRLLRRRKQRVAYTDGIKSVENFVHMFKLPQEEQIKIICETQRQKVAQVTQDVKDRKRNRRILFRPGSSFVSWVFRCATKIFAKRYKLTQDCTGCEICYRVCPPRAIQMVRVEGEGDDILRRPCVIPKRCDFCQACMQLCPHKAIWFGKVTPSSRRYCHEDVKIKELLKRPSVEQ